MELKTFVYKDDGKTFNFYVNSVDDGTGAMQVGGLVVNGALHLFEHPHEHARSADRFDTANYVRLKAKAKAKFGVAKVVTHDYHFAIIKDGKTITIRTACPKGQRTADDLTDKLLSEVLS